MITHDVREPLVGLEEHLQHWLAEGILTPEQAEQIRRDEGAPATPPQPPVRRTALVTEALGYVGGVLVLLASVLLAAQYWDDLSLAVRLTVVGASSALLLVVGLVVPAREGSAGERLRSAAWVLSAGALAFFLGLLSHEVFELGGEDAVLLVAGGTALYALALWARSRAVLQQLAAFVALAVTAAALVDKATPSGPGTDFYAGLGVIAVGALWLVLGVRQVLEPHRLVLVQGGLATVLGAGMTLDSDWGRVLGLVVIAVIVLLAVRIDELALLAVGAFGMLVIVPNVVTEWFPGAVAAPLALLIGGAVLILAALRSLRRGS
jgi:hypothetical protein